MGNIVNLSNVYVSYGNTDTLSDCTLNISAGESVAVLGPNGAGKTTMLEVICGFRRPSQGSVVVFGKNPLQFDSYDTGRLGIVLQHWRDHASWRVEDFISLVEFSHMQLDNRASKKYTQELIDILGIRSFLSNKLSKLSGGERRRVDTCLSLLSKPDLLILDEPTTAFDPSLRRKFHELMREVRQGCTTLIWATHDLYEAEQNCERIILLNRGSIVRDASPDELRLEVEKEVKVEWIDTEGVPHVEQCDNPDGKIRGLLLAGASNIRVTSVSFEDVYLDLLGEMELNNE